MVHVRGRGRGGGWVAAREDFAVGAGAGGGPGGFVLLRGGSPLLLVVADGVVVVGVGARQAELVGTLLLMVREVLHVPGRLRVRARPLLMLRRWRGMMLGDRAHSPLLHHLLLLGLLLVPHALPLKRIRRAPTRASALLRPKVACFARAGRACPRGDWADYHFISSSLSHKLPGLRRRHGRHLRREVRSIVATVHGTSAWMAELLWRRRLVCTRWVRLHLFREAALLRVRHGRVWIQSAVLGEGSLRLLVVPVTERSRLSTGRMGPKAVAVAVHRWPGGRVPRSRVTRLRRRLL